MIVDFFGFDTIMHNGSRLAIFPVEPIAVEVNEFLSGVHFSVNVL